MQFWRHTSIELAVWEELRKSRCSVRSTTRRSNVQVWVTTNKNFKSQTQPIKSQPVLMRVSINKENYQYPMTFSPSWHRVYEDWWQHKSLVVLVASVYACSPPYPCSSRLQGHVACTERATHTGHCEGEYPRDTYKIPPQKFVPSLDNCERVMYTSGLSIGPRSRKNGGPRE